MNAITVPKNPPTAMMGIRTSIGSSRPRSFTRSDPLAVPLLGEEPLGEVEPLLGFRHSAFELVELGEQRLAHWPRHDERGADHQGQANHADSRRPLSHATVPSLR